MSEHAMVLLVEDNGEILRLNRRALERSGYRVITAETIRAAEQILEWEIPDVIVLDLLLPDGNGIDFLPTLKKYSGAPVLILSSLRKHQEVLDGIRAGGDDYMTKPYRIDELLVRIDALWRRERQHQEQLKQVISSGMFRKGILALDLTALQATCAGVDLLLPPKEFSVLLSLARAGRSGVTGQELYRSVWGCDDGGDTRAVRGLISRLRTKLADSGIVIEAEYRKGYRLIHPAMNDSGRCNCAEGSN